MDNVMDHLKSFVAATSDPEDVEAMRKFLKDAAPEDVLATYEALLAQHPSPPPVTEAAQPLTIGRTGRAWNPEEQARRRDQLPPGVSIEIHDGKLLATDPDRRLLAGMLLENLGIDEVIRLGNPETWLEALTNCTALGAALALTLAVLANRLPPDAPHAGPPD